MVKPTASDVATRLLILVFQIEYALGWPPPETLRPLMAHWLEQDRERFLRGYQGRSETTRRILQASGLWEFLTAEEREFFQATPVTLTSQQYVDVSWRMESAVVLMWALGMVAELPPYDRQTRIEALKQVPEASIREIVDRAALRPAEEIEHARGLAELWHWRSRTRELIEAGAPVDPDLGVSSFDEIVRAVAIEAHRRGDLPQIIDEDFGVKGKAYRRLNAKEWSSVRSITIERHLALNWLGGYAPENRWEETPTDT